MISKPESNSHHQICNPGSSNHLCPNNELWTNGLNCILTYWCGSIYCLSVKVCWAQLLPLLSLSKHRGQILSLSLTLTHTHTHAHAHNRTKTHSPPHLSTPLAHLATTYFWNLMTGHVCVWVWVCKRKRVCVLLSERVGRKPVCVLQNHWLVQLLHLSLFFWILKPNVTRLKFYVHFQIAVNLITK